MLRDPIHGSGNPVPWDVEHGAEHRELLAMLHVKRGDYAHWAVRMDRGTRRVTHISAGPVLKARDYRNEVRHDRVAGGLKGPTWHASGRTSCLGVCWQVCVVTAHPKS